MLGAFRPPLAIIILLLAGCSSSNPVPPEPARNAPAVSTDAPAGTREVTDLTKLSTADTSMLAPITTNLPALPPSNPDRNASKNEELTHRLAANAPATRYNVEPSKLKGGSRLLNDKARQYAEFADLLLNQTLKAAQTMAPDKLRQHRVPSDLAPTALTAVMDGEGRLNEIIIEQHSGDLLVDKLFIEACKQGIWSRNPPPGARAGDGTYRVRVEGKVYNQSYDRYGEYSYDTELGLSIL